MQEADTSSYTRCREAGNTVEWESLVITTKSISAAGASSMPCWAFLGLAGLYRVQVLQRLAQAGLHLLC